MRKKVVMIVAHPDDEVLWAGGLPIRYPEFNWTIIACSIPTVDPIRAWQFFDVCEALGARGRLLPVKEDQRMALGWIEEVLVTDHIVSHGAKGEYGHPMHIEVHNWAKEVCTRKNIPMTTFGYGEGEHVLELSGLEADKKMAALRRYSFLRNLKGKTVQAWEALSEINWKKDGDMLYVEHYSGAWFDGVS